MYYIGIDIGGTNLKAGLVDEHYRITATKKMPLHFASMEQMGETLAGMAAALVEEVCDRLEADIFAKYPGCYFPFRFSPGYGDLPLSVQSGLLTLLDAPRKIGLCANENHILTPRKSVTALIGISREPVDRAVRSCQSCPGREGCQYRKSGGHCGAS